MYTLKAKYAQANIMLPEGEVLDEATTQQIYGFLNHPAFANSYIAIMPDAHAGKGACVGFTMKANGYVIPNVVGVDICCGMTSAEILFNGEVSWEKFDELIKETIPAGFNKHQDYRKNVSHVYAPLVNNFEDVAERVGQDIGVTLGSIGTLGGGKVLASRPRG